jgi:hypothetical protein
MIPPPVWLKNGFGKPEWFLQPSEPLESKLPHHQVNKVYTACCQTLFRQINGLENCYFLCSLRQSVKQFTVKVQRHKIAKRNKYSTIERRNYN